MELSEEEIKKYQEKATVENVLKGGATDGQTGLKEEILSQDQYKQSIIDGLLGIRRIKKPMETNNGEIVLQEFVRLEDGSGRWKMVSNIPDDKWKEMKKDGPINERGAKDVLTTLNGVSNNNVALSNLSQKQINDLGESAINAVDSKLRSNRKEYGIDSTDDLEWIMMNIVAPGMVAGLSKPKNGKFLKELLSNTNLVGSLDDEEEDDGGWTASFT